MLAECLDSAKPEFVAVYGRRRVGKTFLVKQYLAEKIDFYMTGAYGRPRRTNLAIFNEQLCECSGQSYPVAANWHEAFRQLRDFLTHLEKKQWVVFLDELPWFDTPKSGFVSALEHFWNSWGSDQPRLKFIVCGSATNWMMNKLIGDRGGLHNRLTRSIHLAPFTLCETEQYLKSNGIVWRRYDIIECYMILGGTPYYLSKLRHGLSLAQNIDELFFSPQGELRREFDFVYRSLFNDSGQYIRVVEKLGQKAKGMTRNELLEALKMPKGGKLTELLGNLQACDFIRSYVGFGKHERDTLYQLTDLFTLFHLRFCRLYSGQDEHSWTLMMGSHEHDTWCGYAFEMVCLHHIPQIKASLGISGVLSTISSWQQQGTGKKAQIDLVVERRDNVINLCEMKYANKPFAIERKYAEWMEERRELFREATKTNKTLHLTMVTVYGVKQNAYSSVVQSEVTMDDLFEK